MPKKKTPEKGGARGPAAPKGGEPLPRPKRQPAARRTRAKPAGTASQPAPAAAALAATPAAAEQRAQTRSRRLRVRQVRSGIGHAETYRRTLRALGLKHHQDEVVVRDHPAIRGMLRKVWHLVSVQPVED